MDYKNLINILDNSPKEFKGRTLNCFPSKPDIRDYKYQALFDIPTAEIPTTIDYRPNLPPVFDQGQRGACHDKETEVLTIEGWKLFNNISFEDKLASVNPDTGEIIFEYPTNIIKYKYKGDMYYGKHQSLDFLVTPNHKMLVRKWNEKKRTLNDTYEFIEIQDIGWYTGLLTNIFTKGKNIEYYILSSDTSKKCKNGIIPEKVLDMKYWLRFLGIFIAEGTLADPIRDNWRIQIAGFKDRERNFIEDTLKHLDIHATPYIDRYYIHHKQLWKELERLGFYKTKAPYKFVPNFIFNLTPELIQEFLFGFAMGDGCFTKNNTVDYYTSSKLLAEQIQILLLFCGKWNNIHIRERNPSVFRGRTIKPNFPEHRILEWKNNNLSIERKNNITKINYDDMVYCAEVPTYHTLITRRNGKILISGNCVSAASAWTVKALQEINQGDFPSKGLSVAYLYTLCKQNDGIPNMEGSYLKTAFQMLQKYGICPEVDMPYSTLTSLSSPSVPSIPSKANTNAGKYKINNYAQICSSTDTDRSSILNTIRQALKTGTVAIALQVYDNFIPDSNGKLPLPSGNIRGSHAIGIVGDLPEMKCLILRNSWGTSWGLNGYAYLPYEWLTSKYNNSYCIYEAWTAVDLVSAIKANKIEVTPNSTSMIVDGVEIFLDVPATLINGRIMLPIRSICANAGYSVVWDGTKAILTKVI